MTSSTIAPISGRQLLSTVPEVTIWFWVIKVLATTVGETFADYLNETLGWGLSKTTYVMGVLLILALIAQFVMRRYIPVVYRREAFYWLAILFTFALGTAAGDLISERLALGYFPTLLVFVGAIAVVAVLHYGLKVNAVLTFWLAYILTRPLGASIGDWLSQPTEDSGLGLGTTVTSFIFLGVIVLVVAYLTITRKDLEVVELGADGQPVEHKRIAWPGDHQ